jgi:hypothetical protein
MGAPAAQWLAVEVGVGVPRVAVGVGVAVVAVVVVEEDRRELERKAYREQQGA